MNFSVKIQDWAKVGDIKPDVPDLVKQDDPVKDNRDQQEAAKQSSHDGRVSTVDIDNTGLKPTTNDQQHDEKVLHV